ncbi:MAG: GNAT family N-acetyltransferase [Candidatus Omnitrophica bacterium]|nr:GNAT family N-acetyltransferase [Candidatus Omnitrophota bacterium]MCM8828309.1 GNAT family N-acetyltransferase [Candidatus Omnitrophota bacterium]
MLVIRKYQNPDDREFIRKICCDSAFLGEPAERFFDGREILADLLTSYYTCYEKESIFIAELDRQIVGYLTGCKNIKKQKRIFMTRILPVTAIKFVFNGRILKKRNLLFLYNCALSIWKKEFFANDFSSEYPATLHINIDRRYRNTGIGKKLICEYISYLKKEKIAGVHVTTFSVNAAGFFEKMGFNVLGKKSVSYFNYLIHRKLLRFTLGRKLINE